jgi:SpoIID/LytB domain protein
MFFMLLIFHFLNSAQALDLPEFSISHQTSKQASTPFPREKVTNFRVQIYPHLGAYSTPQGRETLVSSVTLTSAANCVGYAAVLDANQEWTMGASTHDSQRSLTFRAGGVPRSAYYQCSKPFVVNRASPLTSIEYSGDFVAVITANSVRIINVIDPDTYIKGVIPSEVESTWPAETLKAQAVAARTYAWWSVLQARKSTSDFDMDDTVSYQAYMGNTKRAVSSDEAADATEGLVMFYNGEIIKSYFAADSGGYTEDAGEVFDALPYCLAKPETYDQTLYPASAWVKSISASDLTTALVTSGAIPSGVTVQKIRVNDTDRTTSGRARVVTITGTNGQLYSVTGPKFRYATKIRSNLFTVDFDGVKFNFAGKGFGHGVGMAQIGALQYVKQLGWTYDQVLNFYYSGILIAHD